MRDSAIRNIHPAVVNIIDGKRAFDANGKEITLNETLIEADFKRLQKDQKAKGYLRDREYPPLEDFADAFYWQMKGSSSEMIKYLKVCTDVKKKFPKRR